MVLNDYREKFVVKKTNNKIERKTNFSQFLAKIIIILILYKTNY